MKAGDRIDSGSGLFVLWPDAHAIVRFNGRYLQWKIYHRAGVLYVSSDGKNFDRLLPKGGSTFPRMIWDELVFLEKPVIVEFPLYLLAGISVGELP